MRECPRCEKCYEDDLLVCPDDEAKTKTTLPGTTVLNGRYRLQKRLGRGAMGQVYLARDENLITRRVAVKTIRPDVLSDEDMQEGEAIARFEREARTAASIQHHNVVGVTDLAKIISQSLSGLTSGSGPASRGILGTPEYMAPEQMEAGTQLDPRADIYALGAIAFHMLGGRPPFTGDIMQIFAQKLTQDAPALSTIRSDIPGPVEQSVMHALQRNRESRPATVGNWFDEFKEAAGEKAGAEEEGESRLVIMAPTGAEVYVDDERHGSIGRSGRVILKSIPPGKHVLRVAHAGDKDDERVIEIRADAEEQIIQV